MRYCSRNQQRTVKLMTDTLYLCLSILTMALVTYLVRMLPLAAIRKKIRSPFLLSFLYYVPYAVLTAMTIPGIFFSTGSVITACAGLAAALVAAFFNRGLLTVAVSACGGVLVAQLIMGLIQ